MKVLLAVTFAKGFTAIVFIGVILVIAYAVAKKKGWV